jgi:hypothetical protein
MQRPWILSRKLVVPWGFNALGALEATFGLLPIVLWPDRPADTLTRLIMLATGLLVVIFDAWWRLAGDGYPLWIRAISPYEGGAVFFIPGWLIGIGLVTLCVFALMTLPAGGRAG